MTGHFKSVEQLLTEARDRLDRLTPHQAAAAAQEEGALLVDTRYGALRDRDGCIPGAVVVERNELEWRLDPQCPYRLPEAVHHDLRVIVLCNEGYASSFAAVSLQQLGLRRTTDVIGGFQAWAAAGLPVTPPGAEPSVPAPHLSPHAPAPSDRGRSPQR
ncbi:rhodanese-like domain-containing protein [Kitasatospora sp. MBT63]|uniref:rhodanese-like domain-containing protein n=1 Tax=Kitasatospora sp. MBT63 TaxID=1444768 RepID=UPI00068FAB45|nr:rhodanese-like domain-containing protein [Kitasatospora sp. MBT63]